MVDQFYVSGILHTLGQRVGVNVGCDGIDDLCWGVMITGQTGFTQFLTKHAGPYNYLILDDLIDNVPIIRIVRRAVNSDLVIDFSVNQTDCIVNDPSSEPAIKYNRKDPASLPRTVELQYMSFDRNFAINTQYARNEASLTQQNIYSVAVDFILDDATARNMAYDLLWRMWQQQMTVAFTHPDLTIEPSDIVQLNTDQGVFVVQVLTSLITKEPMDTSGLGRVNQLTGNLLLTQRGTAVNPGQVQTSSSRGFFLLSAGATVLGVGSPNSVTGTFTLAAGATVVGITELHAASFSLSVGANVNGVGST